MSTEKNPLEELIAQKSIVKKGPPVDPPKAKGETDPWVFMGETLTSSNYNQFNKEERARMKKHYNAFKKGKDSYVVGYEKQFDSQGNYMGKRPVEYMVHRVRRSVYQTL